jgi:hypothetical protein
MLNLANVRSQLLKTKTPVRIPGIGTSCRVWCRALEGRRQISSTVNVSPFWQEYSDRDGTMGLNLAHVFAHRRSPERCSGLSTQPDRLGRQTLNGASRKEKARRARAFFIYSGRPGVSAAKPAGCTAQARRRARASEGTVAAQGAVARPLCGESRPWIRDRFRAADGLVWGAGLYGASFAAPPLRHRRARSVAARLGLHLYGEASHVQRRLR